VAQITLQDLQPESCRS